MTDILSVKSHIATADYICHGCGGETEKIYHVPITKDNIYFAVTVPWNRTLKTLKYCARCNFAINDKLRHSKDGAVDISQGSFQWQKLSNAFKKKFIEYFHLVQKWNLEKEPKKKEALNQKRREMELEMLNYQKEE